LCTLSVVTVSQSARSLAAASRGWPSGVCAR